MTWATDRLDALKLGTAVPPPVVWTLRLGLLEDWGPGWARKCWQPHDDVLNGDGSLFGGYIAALADQMLAFAAMSVLPDDSGFRTINLQVQFFRVGQAHLLLIESRVVAQSRSLVTVACDFRREDQTSIATANAQQMIVPLPKAS